MHGLLTDEFEIAGCLARHVATVRETSLGAWEFSLAGRVGTARLEPEWLLLDIPLERLDADAAFSELTRAGRLDGLAKFGFDPATKQLHLQAEIPLVLEDDPMERIDLAFVSLEQALPRDDFDSELNRSEISLDENELKARCTRWKELCDESGWPVHQRGTSKLAVSLDVPGSFCQAILEADGPNQVRIRHEAGKNELNDVSRRGLSVFLLTASHVVRMARAYGEGLGIGGCGLGNTSTATVGDVETASKSAASQPPTPNPQSLSCGWEIVLNDPPMQFELDRALAALSMACRMSTNELAVLTDDEVSRRYLAVQGMVP